MNLKLSIMFVAKRNEKWLTKNRTAELIGITLIYYTFLKIIILHHQRES